MAELEDKMQDSKREMEIADALDEIRVRNARIERNAQQGAQVAQQGIHEVAQKGIHEVAQQGAQVHPKFNHLVPQKGIQIPEKWNESEKAWKKEFPDFIKVDRWEPITVPYEEVDAMDDATYEAYGKERAYRAFHDVHDNYLIRDLKGRVVYLMPPEEKAQGLHKVKDAYKNYPPYKPAHAQPAQPAAASGGEWEIVEILDDVPDPEWEAELKKLAEARKKKDARRAKFPGFKPPVKPGDNVRGKDFSK